MAGIGSADERGWVKQRAGRPGGCRVCDLCIGFAGLADTASPRLQVGTECRPGAVAAVAQMTELVQHRTMLDKHQQQRQNPGER